MKWTVKTCGAVPQHMFDESGDWYPWEDIESADSELKFDRPETVVYHLLTPTLFNAGNS